MNKHQQMERNMFLSLSSEDNYIQKLSPAFEKTLFSKLSKLDFELKNKVRVFEKLNNSLRTCNRPSNGGILDTVSKIIN